MNDLIQDALAHKWLPLAVVIVGLATRALKDDTKFPINIPARFQPLAVVVLSFVYAALQALAGGAPWQTAVKDAAMISVVTMGAFDVLVKTVFNGKDLPAWASFLLKDVDDYVAQLQAKPDAEKAPTKPAS